MPTVESSQTNISAYFFLFLGLNNCDDVLPIYIGDDRTDEDAFKVKLSKLIGYFITGTLPSGFINYVLLNCQLHLLTGFERGK